MAEKMNLDNLEHDPATDKIVGERSEELFFDDLLVETLYCNRLGEYYLCSTYSHDRYDEDAQIIALSLDKAREWARSHLNKKKYETEFGEHSEF